MHFPFHQSKKINISSIIQLNWFENNFQIEFFAIISNFTMHTEFTIQLFSISTIKKNKKSNEHEQEHVNFLVFFSIYIHSRCVNLCHRTYVHNNKSEITIEMERFSQWIRKIEKQNSVVMLIIIKSENHMFAEVYFLRSFFIGNSIHSNRWQHAISYTYM